MINRFSGNGILLSAVDNEGFVIVTPPRPDREAPEPVLPGDPCGPTAYPADPDDCPPPGWPGEEDVADSGVSGGGGGHRIAGCLIGTDSDGTAVLGNGSGAVDQAGIAVLTSGNRIGGTEPGEGNVIAGQLGHGIILSGRNNQLLGNAIGTDRKGQFDLGNLYDGVSVNGGEFSQATCTVRGNTLAFNGDSGISGGFNGCAVLSNKIFDNGLLGIDMGELGVTANDPGGWRFRPLNAPELTHTQLIHYSSGWPLLGTRVYGTLTHQMAEDLLIELYHSPNCDPSGHGEGQTRLAAKKVAGGGVNLPFSIDFRGVVGGTFTATVTTDRVSGVNITSEFSACL